MNWGDKENTALDDMVSILEKAVKLSHREGSKTLCLFTDASDEHYAAVITQCDEEE